MTNEEAVAWLYKILNGYLEFRSHYATEHCREAIKKGIAALEGKK